MLHRVLTACAAVASMACCGEARPGPTLNHVLRAVPAPGAVAIDGDLRDWDLSGAIVMTDDTAEPRRLVRVAAMYDAAGMYLALQFRDRTPLVNHIDPMASRGRAWCGDCVQLRINCGPHPDQAPPKPLQLLHVDAYWYSDGNRATAYAVYGDLSPGGKVERTIEEAEGNGVTSGYRKDDDGLGYVQELRLDWKLLRPDQPVAFTPGSSLHMALEPMWGDPQYLDHPATRVTDLLNPQRPERDMIWANPQALGTVEFSAHGQVEPSATARLWPELLRRNAQLADASPVPAVAAPPAIDRPCLEERNAIERELNAWFLAKTAAGNRGDCYDNRDREHAAIERTAFPQLASFEYTAGQKLENQDYALFTGVRPQVTFGNSSTAAQPDRGGCNPRFAIMDPIGLLLLNAQYRASNLYVYPAHHDYHPGRSGHGFYGDLLPVNQPYCLLSLGSSGSDIPFLNAAIHATAAFTPEVKQRLVRHGLLMPTLQALLRSTSKVNTTAEDYFTGKAHPAVLDGALLDEPRLVAAAHALSIDTIPPLAQVQAEVEGALQPGINAPAEARSERLGDSPGAVGFVFRRWDRRLRLAASAATSLDHRQRPLTYRWVLLQGDPGRVRIEPSADGRQARIAVAWHDRFPVQAGSRIHSNRIDIGVFASNGAAWSAPAFISVVCPDNELRTYDERDRLVDVQYAAMDSAIGYETTCVFPAEGTAPYDILDWPGLLRRAAAGEGDLFARLCATALSRQERAACAAAVAELAAVAGGLQTDGAQRGRNERWSIARRNAERLSQVVLGNGLKERIEGLLNAWQDDPAWYVGNRAAFDEALGRSSTEDRKTIEQARGRLLEMGIYRKDGAAWALHARRPGSGPEASRLTAAERAELRCFHLLLETRVLLPGILQREAQFNYVDHRLVQAQPHWLCFDYSGDAATPPVITIRAQANPPQAKDLENP